MASHIGVLSDTHGMLRKEVKSLLQGCDLVIHAGDIGKISVLIELEKIAQVIAVRGNVDKGAWAQGLKCSETIRINGKKILVIHRLSMLAVDPASEGADAVIHGHSHKPVIEYREGILFLNPGSAGPRRFSLPVSMALLHVEDSGLLPEIIEIRL